MIGVLAQSPVAPGLFGPLEERMVQLVDATATTPAVMAGVAVAVALGAAHALGPGHGKTVTASYVAGTRTVRRDALLLGVAVALMHTLSALVLGVVLFVVASSTGWIDEAGQWLRIAAGLMVLAVGAWLLRRRWRDRGVGHGHHHDHGHDHPHDHVHSHVHSHVHDHTHLAPLDRALSVRGLLVIGASGGLLPSPSALLVLTTGLFTGRTLYAVSLVVAFGVGMALTLTAVALATREVQVRAERWGGTHASRIAAVVPVLGAVVLTAAGAVMTGSALAAVLAPA